MEWQASIAVFRWWRGCRWNRWWATASACPRVFQSNRATVSGIAAAHLSYIIYALIYPFGRSARAALHRRAAPPGAFAQAIGRALLPARKLTVHRACGAVTIVATRLHVVVIDTGTALDHFARGPPANSRAGEVTR